MKKISSLWIALILLFSMILPASAVSNSAGAREAETTARYEDTSGHWAESAIDTWSEYGIIKGYAGVFRPGDMITRGEMATVLDRLLQLQTKAENSFADLGESWYTDAVLRCVAAGILQGDGVNVRPNAPSPGRRPW